MSKAEGFQLSAFCFARRFNPPCAMADVTASRAGAAAITAVGGARLALAGAGAAVVSARTAGASANIAPHDAFHAVAAAFSAVSSAGGATSGVIRPGISACGAVVSAFSADISVSSYRARAVFKRNNQRNSRIRRSLFVRTIAKNHSATFALIFAFFAVKILRKFNRKERKGDAKNVKIHF